jgi:hypothetical protein
LLASNTAMRDLQQYNAPIDFVDGRCDLRLRPSTHALSRAVRQRNRCRSGCIGSARPFARRRRLIHWWRERDSNPRSRKREITFETAPLDDSGYLLLRQIPAPSLQGPTDRIPLRPPLAHRYTSARGIKSSQSLPRAASNTSATADSIAIIGGFRSEDGLRRARGQTPSKCLLRFPRSGGGRRYRWSSVALPSV